MGRPAASETNKVVAIAFAKLVTLETDNPDNIIARCGLCSIFSLLSKVFPSIVRDERFGPREGISEVELNKALQVTFANHK